jgi:hypothetical protein
VRPIPSSCSSARPRHPRAALEPGPQRPPISSMSPSHERDRTFTWSGPSELGRAWAMLANSHSQWRGFEWCRARPCIQSSWTDLPFRSRTVGEPWVGSGGAQLLVGSRARVSKLVPFDIASTRASTRSGAALRQLRHPLCEEKPRQTAASTPGFDTSTPLRHSFPPLRHSPRFSKKRGRRRVRFQG